MGNRNNNTNYDKQELIDRTRAENALEDFAKTFVFNAIIRPEIINYQDKYNLNNLFEYSQNENKDKGFSLWLDHLELSPFIKEPELQKIYKDHKVGYIKKFFQKQFLALYTELLEEGLSEAIDEEEPTEPESDPFPPVNPEEPTSNNSDLDADLSEDIDDLFDPYV